MNPAAMINIFHDVHAVIRDASGELAAEQVPTFKFVTVINRWRV